MVQAVRRNGIGRVVFQSSVGAEKRSGAGEIDGLARTELGLDGTGVDVTHLRCGFFFSNLALQIDAVRAGTIPIVLPEDHPLPWVAPRDVAEVAVARLLSDAWRGRHVRAVHGPADLTWAEATRIVSAAVGHQVRPRRIPDQEMRELLSTAGLAAAQVGAWCYDTLRPLLAGDSAF